MSRLAVSPEQDRRVYKGLDGLTFRKPAAQAQRITFYYSTPFNKITMAFHLSSQDLHIDENRYLIGQLQNSDGEYIDASIDLDQFLGNNDGLFWSLALK